MKRLTVLALALGLSGCAREGGSPGRALFDAHGCRACHKVGDSGGTAGPDLSFVGFRRSAAWLETWLDDPHGWKSDTKMPAFRLKPAARSELVAYLSSLQGEAFEREAPWEEIDDPLEKGKTIYRRAGCVACHGAKGRGGHPKDGVGGVIPALDAVVATYTPEELERRIRDGVRAPEGSVAMPGWGEILTDDEIESVAAYVRTQAKPATVEDW